MNLIENLNKLSFAKYGEIGGLCFDEGEISGEMTDEQSEAYLRAESHRVCLLRQYGMPVLAVSADGLRTVRCFYLDKPVRLWEGIWFRVMSLGEACGVSRIAKAGVSFSKMQSVGAGAMAFSETLTVSNIYTLFYQEREKGFFFPGEQHRPYELVYVNSGLLHSVVGGQDYLLKQGEFMYYARDQWHVQYADKEHPACFISISYDMEYEREQLLFSRKFSATAEMSRLLERMWTEKESPWMLKGDILLCLLKEFILLTFKQLNSGQEPRADSAGAFANENKLVESALCHIHKSLHARLTIESVAEEINVSGSYLSALFRKRLNISPSRYIRQAKLSESKRLIRQGEHNLTEVSRLLGYATPQHFSRCFKQEYGITPSEYAKALSLGD